MKGTNLKTSHHSVSTEVGLNVALQEFHFPVPPENGCGVAVVFNPNNWLVNMVG